MGVVVSLVMTDIVGSTRRWAADEVSMAADLEEHDRVLRGCIAGANGTVVKHTGDGMIAMFDDPVAAVGAAVAIQRAIGETSWRYSDGVQVRIGVHSGVVYRRDDDVFGTAVNRVARVMAVCPAGGVLVSSATAGLLADRAPEGVGLERVGEVEMAGFATPDVVFRAVGSGLVEGQLVTVSSSDIGSTLPPIDDELVGRTDELSSVWDALGRQRLVTLVGVGGMGKTRLALEVAHGAVGSFPGGVWWVDLSVATSPEAVLPVAMAAVGARSMPPASEMEALCERFGDRESLVVFDNCEHVLGAAREVVGAMRSGAPSTRVVCTSREALGAGREAVVPVGSLSGPDGVELFIERAVAVRPDLDVDAHRASIAQVCAQLDGIPLAIELAAARCRSLTPVEILTRLDDRFRLLRGGRSGAERHRTLLAAVEWSYAMLDDDERTVFDTLAVFAGGVLLDGLAAVTGLDDIDLIDIVDRLISRSMVVATETALGTRYHQLETLRQYAEDRLVATDSIDHARDRHLGWIWDLADRMRATTGTPAKNDLVRRFSVEVDNFRVAVAHALASGQRERAHQIVAAVHDLAMWLPAFEVVDWVTPVVPDPDWTDVAAVCASTGVLIRSQRTGEWVYEYPIAGMPEGFITSNPIVGLTQALDVLSSTGDWRAAEEIFGRLEERFIGFGPIIDAFRLLGVPQREREQALSGHEIDQLVERVQSLFDVLRGIGDDLTFCSTAYWLPWALVSYRTDVARRLTDELVERAEPLGCKNLTLAYSLLHTFIEEIEIAADSPADSARALHRRISAALDGQETIMAGALAIKALRLVAPADPQTAVAIATLATRYPVVPGVVSTHEFGIVVADHPEVVARTRAMTTRAVVEDVLAALDRFIGVTEAEAAG
jgi:predicted ATPase/class 3 adenylate cyclase